MLRVQLKLIGKRLEKYKNNLKGRDQAFNQELQSDGKKSEVDDTVFIVEISDSEKNVISHLTKTR